MSTTSYSVIADIRSSFVSNMMVGKIKEEGPHSLEIVYDYSDYDVTATKLSPGCGEEMDFGQALKCLKNGLKVARKSWSGEWAYLFMITDMELHTEANIGPKMDKCTVAPCICMRMAKHDFQPGWLASQDDMLAEDWIVV